jgi:hypothetical protein
MGSASGPATIPPAETFDHALRVARLLRDTPVPGCPIASTVHPLGVGRYSLALSFRWPAASRRYASRGPLAVLSYLTSSISLGRHSLVKNGSSGL